MDIIQCRDVTLDYVNVNKSGFPSRTHSLAEVPWWAWLHTHGTFSDTTAALYPSVPVKCKFLILFNRILVNDATKQMMHDGLV